MRMWRWRETRRPRQAASPACGKPVTAGARHGSDRIGVATLRRKDASSPLARSSASSFSITSWSATAAISASKNDRRLGTPA
jgi:hypothetical protein